MSRIASSCCAPALPHSELPSTHSISRLCGSADVYGCDKRQTATVLAFAHLTGWSAELIANELKDCIAVAIPPEMVWNAHKAWENARAQESLEKPTFVETLNTNRIMAHILREYGFNPKCNAKGLSERPKPSIVQYNPVWYPELPSSSIFEGFSDTIRRRCIGYLSWHPEEDSLSKPTPAECFITDQLGAHVSQIINELLPHWLHFMTNIIIPHMPFARKIEDCQKNWVIICEFAQLFKNAWETEFGTMDDCDDVHFTAHFNGTSVVNIRSTGAAAKYFFLSMLVNRLMALDNRRTHRRQENCVIEVAMEDLPEDVKACHICQEEFGVPDDEGQTEIPMQVVACCGNYFGANCLRKWYGEYENEKCPLCNWTASNLFLEKLLCGGDDESVVEILDDPSGDCLLRSIALTELEYDVSEDGEIAE